jgi:hypothetical protein
MDKPLIEGTFVSIFAGFEPEVAKGVCGKGSTRFLRRST